MAFEKTHLINLKTADGKTLLIPQIPLRTVVNDGYKLADDGSTLVVTSNLESLKAAIDAQIDGKVAVVDGNLTAVSSALDSKITDVDDKVTTLSTTVANDYATKVYVGEQIAAIDHLKREIVTELPTGEAIDTNTIYMVKMGDQGENVYREYMYIEGKWEIVGDSNIDFSNYYTKGEVDTKLGSYYTKGEIDTTIGSYYTKGEVDAELADYALTTYVDAQDGSTLTSANTYADAAVSTASSALNASIAAVDGKFANYYDKDGIAGLGYATTEYVDQASSAAAQAAYDYTDQQLASYVTTEAASQYVTKAQLGGDAQITTIAKISSVSQDGIIALANISGDSANAYTTEAADAKFAPIDGATLTDVVSIAGENAEVTVSKVTATELQIVDSATLVGLIINGSQGTPAASIDASGALFEHVTVTSYLTVGTQQAPGTASIYGNLEVTSNVSAGGGATIGGKLQATELEANDGTFVVSGNMATVGGIFTADLNSNKVTMGSMFEVDLQSSTVKVYDEWTDGETTSMGPAAVATEHDITSAVADANEYTDAASSNIMSTINALPGIGEGAILYDVIEEQI